jgi:hypothetical protein
MTPFEIALVLSLMSYAAFVAAKRTAARAGVRGRR